MAAPDPCKPSRCPGGYLVRRPGYCGRSGNNCAGSCAFDYLGPYELRRAQPGSLLDTDEKLDNWNNNFGLGQGGAD